jgi:CBS domain-containing protein
MKVASILKAKGSAVATTPPRTSVATIARLLREQHIGAMVVSEDDATVLGIITERDIVHGLADRGAGLLDLPVSVVMTRTPQTCTPDDDIQTVMSRMTRYRVRHLPVLAGGRLAGIVSIGDIVKHRLDELEMETNVLRDAFLARQ